MNVIEKVSDITAQDIADYLRIPSTELTTDDENFITMSIGVATEYVLKYTGIADATELDKIQSMVIVVMVLCQEMYDTRALYIDNDKTNVVVETILGMYQRNLL